MFGLAVLFGFLVYFWISVGIVLIAVKWARSYDIKGWKWGVPVGTFMFMTVFWDLIPVYAVHAYQCKNNAGFTVYKTLEEWKQENPGVVETLVPFKNSKSTKTGNTTHYQLNQRFSWIIKYEKVWHIVGKTDKRIVDTKTGDILAQFIDFSASVGRLYNANKLSDYKIWFEASSCEQKNKSGTKSLNFEFNKFMYLMQYQVEYE